MLKEFIKNELKLILITLFLGAGSLVYLDFEFAKLDNYKGILDALVRPYVYGMNAFIIMAWYIVMITCITYIIIEIINYLKSLPKKEIKVAVAMPTKSLLQTS